MARHYREPRFLRSDGKPNFRDRIYEVEAELENVFTRNPVVVSSNLSIEDLMKKMVESGYRRIPVVSGDNRLVGIVAASDIINYFGGGTLNMIIRERHKNNIFRAFKEKVGRIMEETVIFAEYNEKISSVIEKMYKFNVGGLPVIYEEKVVGIVSERDIIGYYLQQLEGSVKEYMSKDIVTVSYDTPLIDAMKLMIDSGYRRLPVTSGERIIGILFAMDIVRYLASGKPFVRALNGRIENALNLRVSDVAVPDILSVNENMSLREAFEFMTQNGIGGVLVRNNEGKIIGILTEKDLLNAIVLGAKDNA